MTRSRWRIGAELLPVLLVLACLAGSLLLVMLAYRKPTAPPLPAVATTVEPAPRSEPKPLRLPAPAPRPASPPPSAPEADPTPGVLARIASDMAEQLEATRAADRRAEALHRARKLALAEADRWGRREMLVRAQLESLEQKAQVLETEAETMALEQDVLVRERDDARNDLRRARTHAGSFAVLPYKGPNGTWQRPIVVECRDGAAMIQPKGRSFSMIDLGGGGFRSDPFIAAIAHEVIKAEGMKTPDGAGVTPYVLFVVRPDGIRPYYLARTRLEPLGIAFGYELVEQEAAVDFPDLDDLAEWRDAGPAGAGSEVATPWPARTPGRLGLDAGGEDAPEGLAGGRSGQAGGSLAWPSARAGRDGTAATGGGTATALNRALGGPPTGRYSRDDRPQLATASPGDEDRRSGQPSPSGRPDWSGRGDGRVEILPGSSTGHGGLPGRPPAMFRASPADPRQGPGSAGDLANGDGRERTNLASGMASEANEPSATTSGQGGAGKIGRAGARRGPSVNEEDVPAEPNEGFTTESPAMPSWIAGSATGTDTARRSGRPGPGQAAGNATSNPGAGNALPVDAERVAALFDEMAPARRSADETHLAEDVLQLVVICRKDGILIQPGGKRLSTAALKTEQRAFMAHLRSVVETRQTRKPGVFLHPRIHFLIEPGGETTYREARKHTLMAGTGWPITLQVAESDPVRLNAGERR